MGATYNADATAAQAPHTAPEPDKEVAITIPVDDDPPNASTYDPGYKGLADHVEWLFRPRAKASDWAKYTSVFRSALLHKRWGIDHLGFPTGKLIHFRDALDFAHDKQAAGSGVVVNPRWNWALDEGSGAGFNIIEIPSATYRETSRVLRLVPGATALDASTFYSVELTSFHADVLAAVEWDAKVKKFDHAHMRYAMGLRTGAQTKADEMLGGLFYKDSDTGNWKCRVYDGATFNDVDSGVALDNNWHRFRVEWHGANVDDASAARMLFILDGAVVANVTTNLPTGAVNVVFSALKHDAGSDTDLDLWVGAPVTFGANTLQDAI